MKQPRSALNNLEKPVGANLVVARSYAPRALTERDKPVPYGRCSLHPRPGSWVALP